MVYGIARVSRDFVSDVKEYERYTVFLSVLTGLLFWVLVELHGMLRCCHCSFA